MYANSSQNKLSINEKEKKKTECNSYQRKKFSVKIIHIHLQQKRNCFHKKWCTHIETIFDGNNKKEFCFCFSVYKKHLIFRYCDFLVRWEKLHCEKRKLYQSFPYWGDGGSTPPPPHQPKICLFPPTWKNPPTKFLFPPHLK